MNELNKLIGEYDEKIKNQSQEISKLEENINTNAKQFEASQLNIQDLKLELQALEEKSLLKNEQNSQEMATNQKNAENENNQKMIELEHVENEINEKVKQLDRIIEQNTQEISKFEKNIVDKKVNIQGRILEKSKIEQNLKNKKDTLIQEIELLEKQKSSIVAEYEEIKNSKINDKNRETVQKFRGKFRIKKKEVINENPQPHIETKVEDQADKDNTQLHEIENKESDMPAKQEPTPQELIKNDANDLNQEVKVEVKGKDIKNVTKQILRDKKIEKRKVNKAKYESKIVKLEQRLVQIKEFNTKLTQDIKDIQQKPN